MPRLLKFTRKDFADHTSTWVEPIYADYENYRLYELPPNGQGIAALEMVKILGNVDMGALGHNSAEYLHHFIEAKKLAYADIDKWNADPEFNDLPIQEMISTEYARSQFQRIDATRAMERPESGLNGDGDTILLGGFIRDAKTDTESGVPFLKDIPLLGNLFKSKSSTSKRSELLVLIRPTILKTPEDAALMVSQERMRLPGIREAEAEFKAAEEARLRKVEKKLIGKSSNASTGARKLQLPNRRSRSKPPF